MENPVWFQSNSIVKHRRLLNGAARELQDIISRSMFAVHMYRVESEPGEMQAIHYQYIEECDNQHPN